MDKDEETRVITVTASGFGLSTALSDHIAPGELVVCRLEKEPPEPDITPVFIDKKQTHPKRFTKRHE